VNAARVARWMWAGGLPARVARFPLVPFSLLYAAVMKLRAAGYRSGLIPTQRLPLPAVAVGNLSVGGTGKTPLAAWIAHYYAQRGRTPGILLRGYGGDEPLVHRRLVSQAVVVVNPDRRAGARRAQAEGADVLILDDAFQLLAVERDLNIAVVSAESAAGSPWSLPAGPWRERWDSLERADVIVVTRKRASAATADAVARRLAGGGGVPVCVACLTIDRLEGMQSGTRQAPALLAGRRVVAAAGIADPESFAAQLRDAGASVQLVAYQDHHPYGDQDLARLVRASAGADYVVVTEKDAVKLRGRWPGDAPEPLVAGLAVHWERNGDALEQALDAVLAGALPTSAGNGNGHRRESTRAS
jgi:tetraacyldisaccharide 4'-kinase